MNYPDKTIKTFNDLFVQIAKEEKLDEETIEKVITDPRTSNPRLIDLADQRHYGEWMRNMCLYYKNIALPYVKSGGPVSDLEGGYWNSELPK